MVDTDAMTPQNRIRKDLAFLYSAPQAAALWEAIQARTQAYLARARLPRSADLAPFSQADCILITYGDQFRTPGEAPLRTLDRFLQAHLGDAIRGVHILPFYPYSSDDGFSVIDYRVVDPGLGGWEDIARLGRSYRLMFDVVLNHVSSESAWFQAFLSGDPQHQDTFITVNPETDLSQVVRPRTLPLLTRFETAGGPRWVWTTFSADQIDLNYASPQVLLEMIDLLLFYVEKGADVLRLDAIAYLWKEPGTSSIHLPQTHAVVRLFRAVLDWAAPHVLLITETNVPHADNISYFGRPLPGLDRTDEADLVYQFPLAPLVLHTLGSGDARRLSEWLAGLSAPGLFFNFIASHDGIGLGPAAGLLAPEEVQAILDRSLAHGGRVSYRTGPNGSKSPYELNITLYDALNDPAHPDPETDLQRFMASQIIMLSLAGVPGIYVHSLFGSRNCTDCVETSGQARSINREKFDLQTLEAELASPGSQAARVLAACRRLLQIRAARPAFHPKGAQRVLESGAGVFALLRTAPGERDQVLCLVNVSSEPQPFRIDLARAGLPTGLVWQDLISGGRCSPNHQSLEGVLQAYQAMWLAPQGAQPIS